MLNYLLAAIVGVTTLLVSSPLSSVMAHPELRVMFQWNFINYTWPNEEAYLKAERDDHYVEEHNFIAVAKSWKNKTYMSIPRWKTGVPVTLGVINSTRIRDDPAPKLQPYPDWDMQKIGDCTALQFVHGMEIDPYGRLWLLDSGRTNLLNIDAKNDCPPRLVILDLEDEGTVLRSYAFPPTVANPESAYLKDIVVDHEDGGYAYISDADEKNPGIIVFSLESRISWKFSHESMRAKDEAILLTLQGSRISRATHVSGLALSPAFTEGRRTLYYSPLSSFQMFSVPTKALRNESLGDGGLGDIAKYVRVLGRKPSQTEGMVMSNTGILYFGLLADDAISTWDIKNQNFGTGQRIISRDHALLQWPYSFSFDDHGQLWCISNRLQTFITDTVSINTPNFRAIRSAVNMSNYQYYENGSAPILPDIVAGAKSIGSKTHLLVASLLSFLLVCVMQ